MVEFPAAFLAAAKITLGQEGAELDLTRADKGNWTGGEVGIGILKGSKYGISAAAYPEVDIADLDWPGALGIYYTDYWIKVRCDEVPPVVAMALFDAAINNGRYNAVKFLQAALDVREDGAFGPITMRVALQAEPVALAKALHQSRARYMIHLDYWGHFADGWEDRLAGLPWDIMQAVKDLPGG